MTFGSSWRSRRSSTASQRATPLRPHQGIDGLAPADHVFGAESALRRALEARKSADELALALEETARHAVYGQAGDQQVALHGESGRLVVSTPDGATQEIDWKEVGPASDARAPSAGSAS